jgi:hypothetical protein
MIYNYVIQINCSIPEHKKTQLLHEVKWLERVVHNSGVSNNALLKYHNSSVSNNAKKLKFSWIQVIPNKHYNNNNIYRKVNLIQLPEKSINVQ